MNKKFLFIVLFLVFSIGLNALAAPKYFNDSGKKNVAPDPIYNKTITIPAGYIIQVTVNEGINRHNLSVPDRVSATLSNDFYYKGHLIAPEGSSVIGMVVKSCDETCQNDAQLLIKFTSIINPNNQIIPISGLFKTSDKKGILYGNSEIKQNESVDIIIMQPVTYTPR